jgi:hypothetical protein
MNKYNSHWGLRGAHRLPHLPRRPCENQAPLPRLNPRALAKEPRALLLPRAWPSRPLPTGLPLLWAPRGADKPPWVMTRGRWPLHSESLTSANYYNYYISIKLKSWIWISNTGQDKLAVLMPAFCQCVPTSYFPSVHLLHMSVLSYF